MKQAVLSLSGGMDSSTVLLYLLNLVLQSSRDECIDFSPELGMQVDTKSQKSKKLPGKSKIYKVPHKHDA